MQLNTEFLKLDNQFVIPESRVFNGMQIFESDRKTQNNNDVDVQEDVQVDRGFLKHVDPYVTSYVCLLAPRFEEHLIIGDLSDWLSIWMKDICISFGWHLKFIDIKPEYLHWIMSVSINSSPMQLMKIIRRETSSKILDEFPRIRIKNLSKDFWSPWQFVRVGQVPCHQSTIQEILEDIRKHQGLR